MGQFESSNYKWMLYCYCHNLLRIAPVISNIDVLRLHYHHQKWTHAHKNFVVKFARNIIAMTIFFSILYLLSFVIPIARFWVYFAASRFIHIHPSWVISIDFFTLLSCGAKTKNTQRKRSSKHIEFCKIRKK